MSTQSPQPTETESIEQRALNEMLETKASRRNVLRGIGATGTAAIAGTAGTVASQEDKEEAAEEAGEAALNVTSPTLAKYAMVADVSQSLTDRLFGSDGEDLPQDEIELHGDATYQMEGIENYYVRVDNNLEDTLAIATLDARHAIASAWEDGEDATTAYNDAMTAIRDYYARHEENHLKVLQNEFLQMSILGEKVAENNDIRSMFVHATAEPVEAGTGTDYDTMLIREAESENQHTFTLENDEEIDLEMPEMQCRVHEDDSTKDPAIGTTDRYPINQELLDSWEDVQPEDTLVWEDSDGVQYDSVMDFVLLDIDDPANEGETLRESAVLFSMRQWMERYQEIKDQSDSATGRFEQDMVDDMYELMDDGSLDSSQVRSAEGMRRFLSGESDVNADSYKLALYNQLDLGQPDLSELAHMQIEYTGFTDQEVAYDDSGRRTMENSDYVVDRRYSGLLYTLETPQDGLESGNSYRIGAQTSYVRTTDGFTEISLESGEVVNQTDSAYRYGMKFSSDRSTVYLLSKDSVMSMDLRQFSENWVLDFDSTLNAPDFGPLYEDSDELYVSSNDNEMFVVDLAEQSVSDPISLPGDGNRYHTGPNGDIWWLDTEFSTIHRLNVASEEIDDIETGYSGYMFEVHPTEEMYFTCEEDGDETFTVFAKDFDGEGIYDFDSGNTGDHMILSGDGENLFVYGPDSTDLICLDTETGEENWREDMGFTGYIDGVSQMSSNASIIVDGEVDGEGARFVLLDAGGSITQEIDIPNESTLGNPHLTNSDVDGELPQSLFYDAADGEEIDLRKGIVTIDSMKDGDGEEIEEPQEWDGGPEYETIDNQEFIEYVERQTEIIETIENGGDEPDSAGFTWPDFSNPFDDGNFGPGGGSFLGLILIVVVVISIAWSVISDFIPFLGR